MKTMLKSGLLISGMCFMTATYAGGSHTNGWGFAPETNFYVGAGLSAASHKEFNEGNSGAGKLFAGVRYRLIGAEIGYLKTGEAEAQGEMPRDPNLKSDTRALTAAAVGYFPIAVQTKVLGKVGAAYWDKDNSSEVELTGVKTDSDDSGFSPLLGIGAEYQLYQNVHLRGEWEHIFSTGEGDYESDIDLLTIGLSMSTL